MAEKQNSNIKRDEYWNCDEYTGRREELIAAGLVDPAKLPGDPGNGKTSLTYRDGAQKVRVFRRGRLLFSVRRHVPAEVQAERNRRENEEWKQMQVERSAYLKAEQAARDLAGIPSSAPEFTKHFRRVFAVQLNHLRDFAAEGNGGYSVSQSTREEIESAIAELAGIVWRAEVVFNRRKREEQVARYRARVAEGDPAFRSFMGQLTEGSAQ